MGVSSSKRTKAAAEAEAEAGLVAIRRNLWEAFRVHFLESQVPINEAAFLHIWGEDLGMGYAMSMLYAGAPVSFDQRRLLSLLWSVIPGSTDGAVAGEDAYRAMRLVSVFARAANHGSEQGTLEADTALPKDRFLQAFAASGEMAADLEAVLGTQVPNAECCWEVLPSAAAGTVTCQEFVACLARFQPPVLALTLQAEPRMLHSLRHTSEHTAMAEPELPSSDGHDVWAISVGGDRFLVPLGAGATAREAADAARTIRSLKALTKVTLMRRDGSILKDTDLLPAALLDGAW